MSDTVTSVIAAGRCQDSPLLAVEGQRVADMAQRRRSDIAHGRGGVR